MRLGGVSAPPRRRRCWMVPRSAGRRRLEGRKTGPGTPGNPGVSPGGRAGMNGANREVRSVPAGGDPLVEIRQAVLADLIAHAREEAPNECCGVLVGTSGRIERSVRARNALGSPTRYRIDPRDQIAAIKSAREQRESVVGFYHSHPSSPPSPSDTDRVEAAYPGHCYLIVSPGARGRPARYAASDCSIPGTSWPSLSSQSREWS